MALVSTRACRRVPQPEHLGRGGQDDNVTYTCNRPDCNFGRSRRSHRCAPNTTGNVRVIEAGGRGLERDPCTVNVDAIGLSGRGVDSITLNASSRDMDTPGEANDVEQNFVGP